MTAVSWMRTDYMFRGRIKKVLELDSLAEYVIENIELVRLKKRYGMVIVN
jgi:hypothetical protein